MEEEKRKSIRVKLPLLMQFSKDGLSWDICQVRDFSESGTKIISSIVFVPGDTICMRLRIPLRPLECLELTGKVIQCAQSSSDSHITRVEFLNLSDDQKELLQSYIKLFLKDK